MIAFLHGTVVAIDATTAYLNVGGVGYAVQMPTSALSKLPAKGEEALVHTYLQVREDGVALFGFITQQEKASFERLISVSGIGPKVALAALSVFSPAELAEAIAAQDVALVGRIPGVGKKTAQRIILELKDSFGNLGAVGDGASAAAVGYRTQAREALLSMGFTEAEIEQALIDAPAAANELMLIQYALKHLNSLS